MILIGFVIHVGCVDMVNPQRNAQNARQSVIYYVRRVGETIATLLKEKDVHIRSPIESIYSIEFQRIL